MTSTSKPRSWMLHHHNRITAASPYNHIVLPQIPVKYRGLQGPFERYRPEVVTPSKLMLGIVFLSPPIVALITIWLLGIESASYWIAVTPIFSCLLIIPGVRLRRWRRRLERHQWVLCLKCGFPLDHSAACGRCPECGAAYTHDSTRWGWRVVLNEWSEDMDPPPPLPAQD